MKLFRKREDPKVCEMVHFVYEHARLSRRNKRYKCTYRVLAKHLTQFEESRGIKLMSNSFNVQVAEDFIYYMNNKGLMLNTIRGYYDKVKYMLRRMSRMGFEVDFSFEHVIIKDEETNAIYITSDEIRRIAELKIRGRERDVVRDRFVCNCLMGFRYGDFSKLTAANIKGNVIFRKTEKKAR